MVNEQALARTRKEGNGAAARPLLRTLLGAALPAFLWTVIGIAAPAFVTEIESNGRARQEDFAVYYVTASELRRNVDPYTTDFTAAARRAGFDIHGIRRASEPPTALVLFEPLTLLAPGAAFWTWQAINLASLALALFLLLGPGSGLKPAPALTLAALALLYPPVMSHFWFAQSKLPLLLVLVAMMRCLRGGTEAAAGLLLAAAGLLRIYPFALAGYLAAERRWRALGYAALGTLSGAALTVALAGFTNSVDFVHGLGYLAHPRWAAMNADTSTYAFIARRLRAFGANHDAALLAGALACAVDLGVLALSVRASFARRAGEDRELRVFALWVASAVILEPISWDHDLVVMLIPFALLARAAARGEASARAVSTAAVSYVLIWFWRYFGATYDSPGAGAFATAIGECATLAMLAAWLAAYFLATDAPAPPPNPAGPRP